MSNNILRNELNCVKLPFGSKSMEFFRCIFPNDLTRETLECAAHRIFSGSLETFSSSDVTFYSTGGVIFTLIDTLNGILMALFYSLHSWNETITVIETR